MNILAHYRKGTGKELLLLHGWGCDKSIFDTFDFNGYTVTAIDFYGFGESPTPSYPVDLDYYVLGVEEIIRKYNMEEITVIGHSFGGRVAIKLSDCDRVSALILCDSAGMKPKRGIKYYYKVLLAKLGKLFKRRFYRGSSDYSKLSGAMKRTFINIVNEDLSPITKKVEKPCLIIWGENDRETPLYMYKRLCKNIKYSRGIVFEGVGHFAIFEQPKRFVALVKEFVKESVI